ncbi:MAG: proline dehydrogenase family protein [Acidobacteria bacterium]|nr:proline dehydrogenase family protein [Acidobacteriota bacterium]
MKIITFFASRFVAGETMDKGIKATKKLNDKNILCTMDILGEDVNNKEEAERFADDYIKLLEEISKTGVNSNVSIKLSMTGLMIDEDFCLKNTERIIKRAKELDNYIRIDMEGSDVTDMTLRIFKTLYKKYPKHVGIVLQAMLFRTEKDVEEMNKLKARVRICKGAYKEPVSISWKKMDDIRINYMKMVKLLIDKGVYPGVATHDSQMIKATLDYVKEKKIPNEKFEFQMLYGIARAKQQELARDGYNVRVYVPFGTAWFPYYFRRLREKKENVFFIMKHFFGR